VIHQQGELAAVCELQAAAAASASRRAALVRRILLPADFDSRWAAARIDPDPPFSHPVTQLNAKHSGSGPSAEQ